MGNIIIAAILIIIVLFALRSSAKHFKGEGGCCGGGSEPAPEEKILAGPIIARKIMHIEGMHCENCKNSVERQINKLDGASAKVNLRKKTAVVSMERMIDDQELKRAVEILDFQVTDITLEQN
ncbi:MAG: heavy metal-associated domain-containing protein [Eubacteriales bacterium]|nr:heavy metal-associated domain-containing protein [Eubacteriales bacterium]